jgi:hypothetical protein
MNILAAILLIGATGHAERSMVVEDQEIAGVFARVIGGAIGDVYGRTSEGRNWKFSEAIAKLEKAKPALQIDGQPRTGWKSWVEAGWRVGAYAADFRADGSVGYSYRLRIRGYDVRRATQIQDGRVVLTTDAWWTEVVPVGRGTRRIPIHVQIIIKAIDTGDRTTIRGFAVGTADTSDFRCGLIRRIAERKAADALRIQLPAALRTIEREGTELYLGSADLGPVLDGIGEAMRTVGPRIGKRQ